MTVVVRCALSERRDPWNSRVPLLPLVLPTHNDSLHGKATNGTSSSRRPYQAVSRVFFFFSNRKSARVCNDNNPRSSGSGDESLQFHRPQKKKFIHGELRSSCCFFFFQSWWWIRHVRTTGKKSPWVSKTRWFSCCGRRRRTSKLHWTSAEVMCRRRQEETEPVSQSLWCPRSSTSIPWQQQ